MHNLECGAHAPVRIAVAIRIKFKRAGKHAAWQRPGGAGREGGALAHAFQIRQQTERVAVAHGDGVTVSDRQGETGALQESRHVAQAWQRRQARGEAAGQFGFGFGEDVAQF